MTKVTPDTPGQIKVAFPSNPGVVAKVKTAKAHIWHADETSWSFPNSGPVLKEIFSTLAGETIDVDPSLSIEGPQQLPPSNQVLDQVCHRTWLKHHSRRTEPTHLYWITKYLASCNNRDPQEISQPLATRPTCRGALASARLSGPTNPEVRKGSTTSASMFIWPSTSPARTSRCRSRAPLFIRPDRSAPPSRNRVAPHITRHSSMKPETRPSRDRHREYISAVSPPVHSPVIKRRSSRTCRCALAGPLNPVSELDQIEIY